MPIVRSRIRNSSLCSNILLFLSLLSVFVLYINKDIFTKDLNFGDPTSLLLLCFGVLIIIFFASIIHLLILFAFENFLNGENSNALKHLWKHLMNHEHLYFLMWVDLAACFSCFYIGLKLNLDCCLVILSASILFACGIALTDYDDVDLSSSQSMEKSIGASWAYDISRRMSEFEEKHDITLLTKKLVIICPLSCNANGSLDGKNGNIVYEGTLKGIEDDEGANNNRHLKTNVYKICGQTDSYIAAEISSPLATLYEMRDSMDAVILQYHRECFIDTLKDLLKSYPCIILEYDDLNSPEPLHSFLLSKLEETPKKSLSV